MELRRPINVRCFRLLQIDNNHLLHSIASALHAASPLQELALLADEDSRLSFHTLLSRWHPDLQLSLTTLDLRGFSNLGCTPQRLWKHLSPETLKEITLQFSTPLQAEEWEDFWCLSISAGLRPRRLSVNLPTLGLTNFIRSFCGLEVFHLLESASYPVEPIQHLLDALYQYHSTTLTVLGICPQGQKDEYRLDAGLVSTAVAFPLLEEFRFGLTGLDLVSHLDITFNDCSDYITMTGTDC